MLNVKTKRYQLPTNTFITIGMKSVLRQYWWAFLIPIVIIIPGLFLSGWLLWLVITAVILTILFVLFWFVQFYGITKLPQGKPFFEKYHFDIRNESLLMMKNAREGMPVKWEMVQRAEKREDAFILWLSRGQFLHLPFDIFKSQLEIKWTESLLKRKKLLTGDKQ